MSQRSRPYS